MTLQTRSLLQLLFCLGICWVPVNALSLPLEHAFHNGKFSPVGRLESPPRELREGPPHLEIRREPFTPEQRSAFEQLVSQDGYYRLRLQPADGQPIMTAIKARCLAGSGMLEAFEAHLDVAGHVIALSWSTPTGSCLTQGGSAALPADWSIKEVQRVPTRMPARGPSLHPSRPAFSDPSMANPGPEFMGDEPVGTAESSGSRATPKVVMGKDGKPVPQPEKTWLQKNWLLIMIGAAVETPAESHFMHGTYCRLPVINVISNTSGAQPAQGGSSGGAQ